MAIKKSQYSILVDVDLNVGDINKQLKEAQKGIKAIKLPGIKEGADGLDRVKDSAKGAGEAMEEASLTFQAANEIFSKTIDVIAAMVDQVYELDAATIEFQKVSDLSGKALDDYIGKLTEMGGAVARTGKPKSQAPVVGMVNQQRDSLEIQYSLRADSATMVA